MTVKASAAPPGPKSRFPGDMALRMSRDPLAVLSAMAAAHGDVSETQVAGQRLVLLTHPDDIRDLLITSNRNFRKGKALERAKVLLGEGLLTAEGDAHLRQRRLVQPAFHRARIAAYAGAMTSAALAWQAQWRDGQQLDANRAMMHITLDIVAATLFGADVGAEAGSITKALDDVFEAFSIGYSPLTPLLDALPTPRNRRFRAGKQRLDATIGRIIAERRAAGTDTGDLLSMLLHATDDEGDGSGMDDQQLRDEAITIFIAGHETTANALTWTWLLLARNPDAERALHAEIDTVLGDRLPVLDDLAQLPMARAIIAESMRLYPPAYVLGRRAIGEHRVREFEFPARTIFLAPQYIVHRDPRWWPEPTRFLPDRWLDAGAAAARPKLAYFPFGAGTRICVGEQFAWMEAVLVLTTLARRWRVRVDGPDPALEPIITLRPRGGLSARLERR
ncbi:MAG TPA: cytochrome P450 [Gemmatimonadaceae bacterium]|nr:cytochrome P450 [Gemmatimonadaceae bacterium]